LSNLDAKLRVQMRAEISQVQHDLNVTTLYVTHDQIEAMTMGDRVAVIKGGVLQQVGAPQFLYDNPTNIFVAGFIGSPPMNLGVGRIIRLGDGLGARFGDATLALHSAAVEDHPALANWVDRDIAIGVRSEDMEDAALVRGGAPENSTLDASVSLTEALGSEIVVHFDLDVPKVVTEDTQLLEKDSGATDTGLHTEKNRFVASFGPRSRVRINDKIQVVVDTERLHFFDPATGLAVRD